MESRPILANVASNARSSWAPANRVGYGAKLAGQNRLVTIVSGKAAEKLFRPPPVYTSAVSKKETPVSSATPKCGFHPPARTPELPTVVPTPGRDLKARCSTRRCPNAVLRLVQRTGNRPHWPRTAVRQTAIESICRSVHNKLVHFRDPPL